MEIAALILSTLSLIISCALSVVFMARNMFSTHTVQMVPIDQELASAAAVPKKIGEEFEEFDMPSPMDVATAEKK